MFISKEVEALYYQYQDNPFGNKNDRRIESWLEILRRLPTIHNPEVELINGVNIDFDIKDNLVAIKGWGSKIKMGLKQALAKFRKKNKY